MSTAAPTFDDIDANAQNLAQLLDTVVENLMNVNYPANVGDLTRVASLLIIARDLSVSMVRDFDTAHRTALAERGAAKVAEVAA